MNTTEFLQKKGMVKPGYTDMMISGDFGSVSVGALLLEFRAATMRSGVARIAEERHRQVQVEGWTPEHDDDHADGELANAAAVYAMTEDMRDDMNESWGNDMWLRMWPFDLKWLKFTPENRVKQLAKAGALIAAEIERLERFGTCATCGQFFDDDKECPSGHRQPQACT